MEDVHQVGSVRRLRQPHRPSRGFYRALDTTERDARSAAVGAIFEDYFDAINTADYPRAWSHLTGRFGGASPDSLAAGDATSFDGLINLASVSFTSSGSARAHLTFTSFQAAANGPNGDTCDIWDLDYTLVQLAGTWLIDGVKGHGGGPTHTTC